MNISTVKAHMDIAQPVRKSRLTNPGWFLVSPSVALLLLWMIVPLGMTVYFSLIRYNLLYPCLLYTSPSPRDGLLSRMPSSA